ncbi:hypothetical protein K1T71_014070 [Dendrolimus kikuchii]|uniref:Uncharacterized protein n=1 Tax=Dendrolimus kikuchii TaxID=765133 RepID=A0ACC1CF57_9NEOP|nr:hypothetical protein K1T71_014070 [Dendrolimus kikuchii]
MTKRRVKGSYPFGADIGRLNGIQPEEMHLAVKVTTETNTATYNGCSRDIAVIIHLWFVKLVKETETLS